MQKHVVVVGAGMSGLAVGLEAAKRGWRVTVVEKAPFIGGLTRSFVARDCILDVGVHLLHLRDPEVAKITREVVPADQWIKIKRKGKLYIEGAYIDWPLKVTSGLQMPKGLMFKILWDQITGNKTPVPPGGSNFQSEILSMYGPTLYNALFHPLTKRFLRQDPLKVHADWAFSSIRSATKIEDKDFTDSYKYLTEVTTAEAKKDFNIFKFLAQQLSMKDADDAFYYFKDGYGVLPNSFRDRLVERGGKIITGTTVDKVDMQDKVIKKCILANGEVLDCDAVVWTGSPRNLCDLLQLPPPGLTYLHSKFGYAYLKKKRLKHQVCYYADADISFVRGTILSNHSQTIIKNPDVADVVCLEFTYSNPEELKADSAALWKQAIQDMIRTRLISSESELLGVEELNVPFSYPVLTLDYKEHLSAFRKSIAPFKNLFTLGRQAAFGYENADVIIKEAADHELFKR